MIGRAEALNDLDLTERGFWASFWAFPLALPLEFLRALSREQVETNIGYTLFSELGIAAVLWFAPLIVLIAIARPLGFSDRFPTLVIASNWGTLTFAVLMLPLFVADILVGGSGLEVLFLVALCASLYFGFMLTHTSLAGPIALSFTVFAINLAVTMPLAVWLHASS